MRKGIDSNFKNSGNVDSAEEEQGAGGAQEEERAGQADQGAEGIREVVGNVCTGVYFVKLFLGKEQEEQAANKKEEDKPTDKPRKITKRIPPELHTGAKEKGSGRKRKKMEEEGGEATENKKQRKGTINREGETPHKARMTVKKPGKTEDGKFHNIVEMFQKMEGTKTVSTECKKKKGKVGELVELFGGKRTEKEWEKGKTEEKKVKELVGGLEWKSKDEKKKLKNYKRIPKSETSEKRKGVEGQNPEDGKSQSAKGRKDTTGTLNKK